MQISSHALPRPAVARRPPYTAGGIDSKAREPARRSEGTGDQVDTSTGRPVTSHLSPHRRDRVAVGRARAAIPMLDAECSNLRVGGGDVAELGEFGPLTASPATTLRVERHVFADEERCRCDDGKRRTVADLDGGAARDAETSVFD